jgi:isopenicillin N synthase-like dioxygenase
MNNIPVIDVHFFNSNELQVGKELLAACAGSGCFYIENHGIPAALSAAVLSAARDFFALSELEKKALHIQHSAHFRGYSQMKNERDWREQIHFGPDDQRYTPRGAAYDQLMGPNFWPNTLGQDFQDTLETYFLSAEALGRRLLRHIGLGLGFSEDVFSVGTAHHLYTLMKLLCYYPQQGVQEKPGVAPHCDWSWLTVLLQDDTPGLEVLMPNGAWVEVPPRPGALFVNIGELLELASGGYFRAAPHQVLNPSREKQRLSVPVFINPALDTRVQPLALSAGMQAPARALETEHVHRVARPGAAWAPFVFGESEWARKGEGKWCYEGH